ncbi:serine/threonine protein kinase [Candidatus Uabimicrobium amorphum]|uniref:non-specific serine/threonine protein kinase n=1 Tax=Uabimicrobium amorphum TaxID=2596890 RepID=A0A5S9F6N5_UABAM|nr:serine/threonine-protein kinase [Candidatus Uabimicrobium amorphum]BBM87393.1 serine/threonine-protein kinase PksC [Candidatus Uabimicrobium amorphum]
MTEERKKDDEPSHEKTVEFSQQQTSDPTMFIPKTAHSSSAPVTINEKDGVSDQTIVENHSSPQTVISGNDQTILHEEATLNSKVERQDHPTEFIHSQSDYAQKASEAIDWKNIKPGDKIGRYEIQLKIGMGGMGAVFKAFDNTLQRVVAIKLVLGISNNDRFLIEAQTTAKLNHPNIVSLYDIVELGENNFAMVMEYIDGKTLGDILREEQVLEVEQALRIIRDAARALQKAHKVQIIHRDIKPGNIMIDSGDTVKVTDFGLAKMLSVNNDVQLTQPNMILGTPAYMSPEQIQGGVVDGKSDIYSLGVTLYQLLSGQLPIVSSDLMELLAAHIQNQLVSIEEIKPEIPRNVVAIVNGMLTSDHNKRWDTQNVISAISTYLNESFDSVHRSTQREVLLEDHFFAQHMKNGQQQEKKGALCEAIFEYQKAFEKRPTAKAALEKVDALRKKVIEDIHQKMKCNSWQEAIDLCYKMQEVLPEEREVAYLRTICEGHLKNQGLKKQFAYVSIFVVIVVLLFNSLSSPTEYDWSSTEQRINTYITNREWGKALGTLEQARQLDQNNAQLIDKKIIIVEQWRTAHEKEIAGEQQQALLIYEKTRNMLEGHLREIINQQLAQCKDKIKEQTIYETYMSEGEKLLKDGSIEQAISMFNEAKKLDVDKSLKEQANRKLILASSYEKKEVIVVKNNPRPQNIHKKNTPKNRHNRHKIDPKRQHKFTKIHLATDEKWNLALRQKQQRNWEQAIVILRSMFEDPKYKLVKLDVKRQMEECFAWQYIEEAQKSIEKRQWEEAADFYLKAFQHSPGVVKALDPVKKSNMLKRFASKAQQLEKAIAQKNWQVLRSVFWRMGEEQQDLFLAHYRSQLKNMPAPQINVTLPPQAQLGKKLTFLASFSPQLQQNIQLLWNFGNGETKAGWHTSHTYYKPGTFVVKLNIDDGINYYEKVLRNYNVQGTMNVDVTWEMKELENGFYEFSVAEDFSDTFYTWKFADGNVRCGKRVRYKFAYSGRQLVELVVFSPKGKKSVKRKVNILHADHFLERRKKVYRRVQQMGNLAMAKSTVVDLPAEVVDARLAFGGAYVVLRLQDSRRLKVYSLLQRKFINDIAMPDVSSVFATGGSYLIAYSKNNNLIIVYDYLTQKIHKHKDFPHKIIDIVMGLDNDRLAFVTILEEKGRRGSERKYALMDTTTFNISPLALNTQYSYYASTRYRLNWRSDAYLYNLTCHQNSGSPWGVQWMYLRNARLETKREHNTRGYLPLELEGQYVFCSQGTILKNSPSSQIHRERSHIFPIYGSSYYVAYKKGKRYRDPGTFQIKDVYTLDVIKEVTEGQSITAHPYHVKDFHFIASAISDTMIQIKKNKMHVFSLGILGR